MTNLIPCVDCGQLISRTAAQCPNSKCKSEYPRGIYCRVCSSSVEYLSEYLAESQPFPVGQALTKGSGYSLVGYHPECVQRVLKVPDDFACADCGMPIAKLWDWERLFNSKDLDGSCPECGKPNLIAGRRTTGPVGLGSVTYGLMYCYGCKLPILLWHKLKIQSFGIGEESNLYHDFCLAKKFYLEERHHSVLESKKAQRDAVQATSSGGCVSLLLIGTLIILLLISVRF